VEESVSVLILYNIPAFTRGDRKFAVASIETTIRSSSERMSTLKTEAQVPPKRCQITHQTAWYLMTERQNPKKGRGDEFCEKKQ
jgi:hypothetical protein